MSSSLKFLLVIVLSSLHNTDAINNCVSIDELQDLKNEINMLKAENQNLKKDLIKMNEKWSMSEQKHTSLETEFSSLKSKYEELDATIGKLCASQKEIIVINKDLKNLIRELANYSGHVTMNKTSFQNETGSKLPVTSNNQNVEEIVSENPVQEVKRLLLPVITTPEPEMLRVAFCGLIKTKMHDAGYNQAISFENVITDTHNSFHGQSGIFTAPQGGNYVFFVNVLCYPNKYLEFEIVKDGKGITEGHCENQGGWGSTTTPVIFHVDKGEKVWVRMEGNDHSSGDLLYPYFSLFGGFIL